MRKPVITLGPGKPDWFEKSSHTAQGFYRSIIPFGELEREGHLIVRENLELTVPDAAKTDILFLHVPTTQSAITSAMRAKQYGVKVWVDFDDLLWPPGAIPMANLAGITFRQKPAQDAMQMALSLADVVTTSTDHLRLKLIEHYKDVIDPRRVATVHNAFPDRVWSRRKEYRPTGKKVRILWRGSITHEGDVYRYRNGWKPFKNIAYHFFGHNPVWINREYDGHLDKYSWTQWQPGLMEYFEQLKRFDADYVLVPLEDNDFNRAKSNIAWLEGAWAGMACMATDTMPEFAKVPTIGFNSPRSLEKTLQAINKGEDLRTEKYMESRAVIEKNYLLSHTNPIRMKIVNSLI